MEFRSPRDQPGVKKSPQDNRAARNSKTGGRDSTGNVETAIEASKPPGENIAGDTLTRVHSYGAFHGPSQYRDCHPLLFAERGVHSPSQKPRRRPLMDYFYVLAGIVALGLLIYLAFALLKPEVFE